MGSLSVLNITWKLFLLLIVEIVHFIFIELEGLFFGILYWLILIQLILKVNILILNSITLRFLFIILIIFVWYFDIVIVIGFDKRNKIWLIIVKIMFIKLIIFNISVFIVLKGLNRLLSDQMIRILLLDLTLFVLKLSVLIESFIILGLILLLLFLLDLCLLALVKIIVFVDKLLISWVMNILIVSLFLI